MIQNLAVNDPMVKSIQELNAQENTNAIVVPNMQGLGTEMAVSNKWFAYIPLGNVLGKGYSNLEMNIKRFSIPQLLMGSTSVSFKGYQYEFPTKLIDADSKEFTVEYLIDSKWQNYRSLFKWCCATEGQINQVIDTGDVESISMTDLMDIRIYLLDHFKNKIIAFCFKNCWVKIFQDLSLEASNTDEITHSVTFCYSNYEIEDC